jgi:hypothetical protein
MRNTSYNWWLFNESKRRADKGLRVASFSRAPLLRAKNEQTNEREKMSVKTTLA